MIPYIHLHSVLDNQGVPILFDKKMKGHIKFYIIQCLIATASITFALYYMDAILKTTIVSSIGATSFIIFTMPHSKISFPKYILGGYIIGVIIGVISNNLLLLQLGIPVFVVGACAVGLTMFFLVITDTEHPPAAAIALGIAIDGYNLNMIIFIFGFALLLLSIKYLLRHWLIDLI